jgi:hypothetical protein
MPRTLSQLLLLAGRDACVKAADISRIHYRLGFPL